MKKGSVDLKRQKKEKGSYLVLGAFVLVALMITGGLAVDISRKYMLEQKAQDTADAAAKAGVAMMPSVSAMTLACTTYIQQSAGAWYVPREEDVVAQVSADNLSGTVGVFVRGTWDPIIMPAWLIGDNNYEIGRYAIARGVLNVNNTDTGDTIGATDLGNLALWIGDTGPGSGGPACGGDYNAQISSNNVDVWGMTQINHDLVIGPGPPANSVDFHGDVNVAGTITGVAVPVNTSTTTEIATNASIIPMPQLPIPSEVNVDLTLDINLPGAAAYYAPGAIVPLVDPVDGIYGNGNDVPIMASNTATPTDPVMVRYTNTVAGHQKWDITGPVNKRIQAGNNPTYGNGFDLKVVGDLNIPNSIDGMDGMIWTTGTLTLGTNNGMYLTTTAPVAGKDNPGSLFYTGPGATAGEPSLTLSGNFSQGSFTGLLYVDGGLSVTGNSSNNTQAVVGAVWAAHIDLDCGSDVTGNNWGILGNTDAIAGVPLAPASNVPTRSTPTVWLQD